MSPVFPTPTALFASSRRPVLRSLGGLGFALLLATTLACGEPSSPASPDSANGAEASGAEANGAEEGPAQRTVSVRTRTLTPRPVVDRAELPADLLPRRRATLAAEVEGVVERLSVDLGEDVSRGQVLATVDRRALEQALAEAQAMSKRSVERLERAQNLFERRSITRQLLLDALTDRDVDQTRLDGARLELTKSRLAAPWAGRVAQRFVEVGDYVTLGQPMVEILDASVLKARAPVPASDVVYMTEGTPVLLTVEGGLGVFEGTIERLGAELDVDSRTLLVEADIPNRDGRLKPGMIAHMAVQRRVLPEALLVPQEALVDLGGRQAIFVVEDGHATRREVTLGPTADGETVVLEGLAPGDRVVVRGQDALGEGQPVEEATAPGSAP